MSVRLISELSEEEFDEWYREAEELLGEVKI